MHYYDDGTGDEDGDVDMFGATIDYDDNATGGDEPSDNQMTHRERDRKIEGGTRGDSEGPGESEGKKERGGIPGEGARGRGARVGRHSCRS